MFPISSSVSDQGFLPLKVRNVEIIITTAAALIAMMVKASFMSFAIAVGSSHGTPASDSAAVTSSLSGLNGVTAHEANNPAVALSVVIAEGASAAVAEVVICRLLLLLLCNCLAGGLQVGF